MAARGMTADMDSVRIVAKTPGVPVNPGDAAANLCARERGYHLLAKRVSVANAIGPSRNAGRADSAALKNIRRILSHGRTAANALQCAATGHRNRPLLHPLCFPG
jgi:hypothetical protein